MIPQPVKNYLDAHQTHYTIVQHTPAFTAQEVAASTHISGKEMAKTVIVRFGRELAMAVVPASKRVSLVKMGEIAGVESPRLANEYELIGKFPGCELGAMPPFGDLYGMEVIVDESLEEDPEIAFNAGTHTDVVKIPYREFEELVHPRVASIIA